MTDYRALREQISGPVLLPDEDGYDAERSGLQTAWRPEPAVVVGAMGADDVRAAVGFAGAHDLPVAIQAAGHGQAGPQPGGMLISTRRMDRVRVDPEARTAWVEAGVRSGRLVEEAARHGLAPLSGTSPDVGVVPYTLGGGLGLLARRYGYAADLVRSIDIVTADGRLRHVSAGREPDLFWALRGGRGNFGVVTALEVALVPVARIYGGSVFLPAERASLEVYLRWAETLPDEATSSLSLFPFPDAPFAPEPVRGRRVAIIRFVLAGDAAAGERLAAPLREGPPVLMEKLAELPYTEGKTIYNEPAQPHPFYGDNAMLRGLDATALAALLEASTLREGEPWGFAEVRQLGGALGKPADNPIGHRDASYLVRMVSSPEDADQLRAARQVQRRVLEAMRPWATGGRFLNFLYADDTAEDRVRSLYDPGVYERLARLKATYDPANMFRFNENIPPAAPRTGSR